MVYKINKLSFSESLINEFTNNSNRSKNQTLFLYDLVSSLEELKELEKAIKYLHLFYCPGDRCEVLYILTKYRLDKWLKEELFIKY